ncbi:FadR family transcriptional regulator [Sphingomonas cannabina]|uniref:FadR/GntR family transcriptional regulator n=1 Tax=Sphingomonas cannabina TaxID=2899123 RepID=UPI001F1FE23E|nr:FadR/GntR family transcriptional regulator [Sphingomonas cannabina]UIJ47202.1 FadR family transcriptional regulator [Sphingomonas cannabina]
MRQERLYEHVKKEIAAKIAAHEYPVGSKLPSERLLSQAYAVSRPTIREALIALELDGQVEVRHGYGIIVTSASPAGGKANEADVGPFELLEARRAIEAETCALAAQHADAEDVRALEALLEEMVSTLGDFPTCEDADRRFHLAIARASRNSAFEAVVEQLWDMRDRSAQYRLVTEKARAAGVAPVVEEHRQILAAITSGDPDQARACMRSHINRVLRDLLHATEVHEIEQVRARLMADRRRYADSLEEAVDLPER